MNSASRHLKHKPHARGSSVEWLNLRDAKVQQLRRELSDSKPPRPVARGEWRVVSVIRALSEAMRSI